MKKLIQYIEEHYITGTDKESVSKLVDKYGDDMFAIIEYGYRDIGGCSGIEKKEDIVNKADFAKLYRNEGKIVAIALYADKRHPNAGSDVYLNGRTRNRGRKIVAMAASEGNVWGEFSSKAATFALRCGALPIPIEAAEAIMDPKKFYDKKEDGYFYTRDIKGHKHTKIMMENHLFYNHNVDEKLTEEDIQKFKKLAIKYAVEDEKLNHI